VFATDCHFRTGVQSGVQRKKWCTKWCTITSLNTTNFDVTNKKTINKSMLDSLEPTGKVYRIWDAKMPGFHARVTPKGRINFAVRYHYAGQNLDYTIGPYPELTPKIARDRATAAIGRQRADKIDLLEEQRQTKAEIKEQKLEQQLDNQRTLEGFIEHKYKPWVEAHLKSHKEQLRVLNADFKHLMKRPLSSLTQWDVQRYSADMLKKDIKRMTINRRTATLKACLSKAAQWGVIEYSPLAGLKRLSVDEFERIRFLSDEEEIALRKALGTRQDLQREERIRYNQWRVARHMRPYPTLNGRAFTDHIMPIVLLALNTGMRRGEIFKLEWSDLEFSRKQLRVKGLATKTGRTRYLPLNKEALRVLQEAKEYKQSSRYVFPSPVTGKPFDNINTAWRQVLTDAQIEGFRFHDLRHTFASNLVMNSIDLNTVRELLGHRDLTMTLRYAHLAPQHNAEAVAVLDR
jgi:integrase